MKQPLFALWVQDPPETGLTPGYLIKRDMGRAPHVGVANTTTSDPRKAMLQPRRFWTNFIANLNKHHGGPWSRHEIDSVLRLVREEDLP